MPCELHREIASKAVRALDQNDAHAVASNAVEHGLEARTVGDGIGARYRSIVELGNDDVAVRLGERRNGRTLPSALAVCRLMTSSNLVDCKTGRSAGFTPLRI